jgi:ribosomal protein S18 acetylase RimI-like enzyme
MRIDHKKPVTVSPLPWGLTVKGLNTKKELTLWAEIQNEIFKDYPNYEHVNIEVLGSLVKHSCFDPNLLVIGTVFDRPVGYCFGLSIGTESNEKTLKIEGMGVLPECRRKGYGQALMFEIINRAYIKGHTSSELVVLSTNQAAIDLYEKCGFKERYRHLWYKRTVEY